MSSSVAQIPYKKGENKKLDERFARYKKMRVFQGSSHYKALSEQEIHLILDLWKKETFTP